MRTRQSPNEPARLVRWRRWTDGLLLTVGIGSVPIMMLELIRDDLSRHDQIFVWLVALVVAVAFSVDYAVELYLSGDRWRFVKEEKITAAIVLSSIVALIPAASVVGGARLIRLAPAIRAAVGIGRMVATGGLVAREGRRLIRRNTFRVALAVTGLTWVSSAVTFRIAEGTGTVFDSLWWSAATITTVGYGDLYPVTTAGRVAGIVAMIVGITAFGVLTARLAAFLGVEEAGTSVED